MISRFTRVRASVRRHGALAYFRRLSADFMDKLFHRQVACIFVLEEGVAPSTSLVNDALTVEEVVLPPKGPVKRFLNAYVPRAVVDFRIRSGWRLMAASKDGKVLGVSWFNLDRIYVATIDTLLEYGDSSGYIEGTVTGLDARGQGVAPAIRVYICKRLREMGAKKIYVCAGDDNPASQAVAKKCGFVPYERVEFHRLLFRKWKRRTILDL